MWNLVIRYPGEEPRQWALKPGITTVGRKLDNDIILPDTSASRLHAEIEYRPDENVVVIRDSKSANGTYLNLHRLERKHNYPIRADDLVQIGATEISLKHSSQVENLDPVRASNDQRGASSRPPVLNDEPFSLLYETARQLNTLPDTETALQVVSNLMKDSMGADKCAVILASQFDKLRERGFSITIASMAMARRAPVAVPETGLLPGKPISDSAGWLLIYSALCAPVMNGENVIALIYLYKTDPSAPPFDEKDVSMAEAISHMVALTIERMNLFQRIHDEQRLRQLLQSHLAPASAEYLLHDFLKTGRLPGLGEEQATVLVADIADSTGWAERLGARLFGRVLKQYYQDMTNIVLEHGGRLNKYLGDGVMALFGLTGDCTDPDRHAVNASLAMLDLFERKYHLGTDQMYLGMGVNSGPVMAGYIDTKEQIEFVVLGDAVNVAFGLQSLARPNRLFIGPTTFQAIQGRFKTSDIGPVVIKGRTEPVAVHEVPRTARANSDRT